MILRLEGRDLKCESDIDELISDTMELLKRIIKLKGVVSFDNIEYVKAPKEPTGGEYRIPKFS